MPNYISIFIHFSDTVERDCLYLAFCIIHLKGGVISFFKDYISNMNPDNLLLYMILITDFEDSLSEFFIPMDSV